MTEIASWLRRRQLDTLAEQAIARAVRDAGAEAPPHPNRHLPGDAAKLRGIPVVGVRGGLGGHIRGTRP